VPSGIITLRRHDPARNSFDETDELGRRPARQATQDPTGIHREDLAFLVCRDSATTSRAVILRGAKDLLSLARRRPAREPPVTSG
jgi:hypothetical protein